MMIRFFHLEMIYENPLSAAVDNPESSLSRGNCSQQYFDQNVVDRALTTAPIRARICFGIMGKR